MSQTEVLEDAQDLLMQLGSETFLLSAFPDTIRFLAMRCPVFTEVRMVSTYWVAGQWTEATQTFTDDTVDAQDVGVSDFAIGTSLDYDGHMLGAYGMFEKVVYTIGKADNATGSYEYAYWDGDAWQPLSLLVTPNFSAIGDTTLQFLAPEDWRQGVPIGVTFPLAEGFDANLFWVRVRSIPGTGGFTSQDELESVSQAMFLTIPPKGNSQLDKYQAAGLARLPVVIGRMLGQDAMESASQAMFLTVPPKGNSRRDKNQAAGLFGMPIFPVPLAPVVPVGIPPASATILRFETALYPLSDTVLSLLTVLYDPNELEPASVAEGLDLLSPGWRTTTGTPTRYTQDLGPVQRVRLTPIPAAIGTLGIPIFTGTFGATVGPNNLVLMTLEVPEEPDLPPWFEGLVGYALAAREARRLGEASDLALAQTLDSLVDGLVGMLAGLWQEDGTELSRPYVSPLRR